MCLCAPDTRKPHSGRLIYKPSVFLGELLCRRKDRHPNDNRKLGREGELKQEAAECGGGKESLRRGLVSADTLQVVGRDFPSISGQ